MPPAIRVENISKQYRIGAQGPKNANLSERFTTGAKGFAQKVRRLADPRSIAESENSFWALKDVSFEIQPGEVVGIIGRNGAGKSTLLKILSRIVEPTRGRIEYRGRMGSLLEVGTGFHPELTGRENIYLNGTILGMSKKEIDRKFDEIVDFSEIEAFLDTPVKRYSSGMYVRLAFAVAAHLEPEILIVDEVLAVGDAAFQKKCLEKMSEIAKLGRTIIYVSHNLSTVKMLTNKSLYLKNGELVIFDSTEIVIKRYLDQHQVTRADGINMMPRHLDHLGIEARFQSIRPKDNNQSGFLLGEELLFDIYLTNRLANAPIRIGYTILDDIGNPILSGASNSIVFENQEIRLTLRIADTRLAPGKYGIDFSIGEGHLGEARVNYDVIKDAVYFVVQDVGNDNTLAYDWMKVYGNIIHKNAIINTASQI